MPASNVRYGLKTLPRTEFGDGFGVRALDIEAGIITAAHLDASFALPMASISQGALVPDKIGLPFTNKTGGTLTKGTLVYHNSWDTSTSLPTMAKAAASTYATSAAWIVLADVINNASGTVGQHLSLTGQNTNAATVGDNVYLHTTAGTYSLTTPPAVGEYYQIVGTVSVKSATVGVVELRIMAQSAPQALDRLQVALPTIPTTGAVSGRLIMPNNATVLGFKGIFKDALVASDSNYITWTITNLGQTSGGTAVMLATSPAGINTTKTTGGTAIAVNTAWVFTTAGGSPMVVVGGDMLLITATVTGTLPNTVTEGVVSAVYAPA